MISISNRQLNLQASLPSGQYTASKIAIGRHIGLVSKTTNYYGHVKLLLNKSPSIGEMLEILKSGHYLQDHLGRISPLLYKLLTWIYTSNRAYLAYM